MSVIIQQKTFEEKTKGGVMCKSMLWVNNEACYVSLTYEQSINQFYFIFVQISIHRNKLHSSGQKKETMAKRYTLIHAHE